DPDRLDLWVHNMKRQNWTPKKNSRLCSQHFERQHWSIDTRGWACLKNTAVPTIFSHSKGKEGELRRVHTGRGSDADAWRKRSAKPLAPIHSHVKPLCRSHRTLKRRATPRLPSATLEVKANLESSG
ncbi:unnamed protein product, partial [Pleuronectes platessa]